MPVSGPSATDAPADIAPGPRRLKLWPAAATGMVAMIGVGPFITIPLLLQSMPGPQAMLGWVLGALIALADGLVLAELGAAFPRSGGAYHYLLQAYGPKGPGRLLSFLFLWSIVITGPFGMASGAIGFAEYPGYLFPAMTPWQTKFLAMGACLVAASLVYRRIDKVGRWAQLFAGVVAVTLFWIIVEGFRHADPGNLALPAHALTPSPALWTGLGGATLYALYDYFGYGTVCSVGGEVVRPERRIPRAILLAIGLVAALYITMNLAVISPLPWREAAQSRFVASDLIARLDGPGRAPPSPASSLRLRSPGCSAACCRFPASPTPRRPMDGSSGFSPGFIPPATFRPFRFSSSARRPPPAAYWSSIR